MFEGMNYDPKDDPNVLLLIEAKDTKKFTKITTYADPMVQSEQIIDHLGYIVDITKEGVILLSFYYTSEKKEDIIHFKKSIKFINIDSVEINTISYDLDYNKKIYNYLKLASQYGIDDNSSDINLEPFSSTKYDSFIVTENKLISFEDETSLIKNELSLEDIDLLSNFVEEYEIKKFAVTSTLEDGSTVCYCGNIINEELIKENELIFKNKEHGLCNKCWHNMQNVVTNS